MLNFYSTFYTTHPPSTSEYLNMLIVHWAATGCHFAPIVATVAVVIITTSIFYFLRDGVSCTSDWLSTCHVADDGLELLIFLLPAFSCCDHRHVPPHPSLLTVQYWVLNPGLSNDRQALCQLTWMFISSVVVLPPTPKIGFSV